MTFVPVAFCTWSAVAEAAFTTDEPLIFKAVPEPGEAAIMTPSAL